MTGIPARRAVGTARGPFTHRSREEALEWSRRFPNPAGRGKEGVIELRQLYELDDFPPSQPLEDFKKLDAMQGQQR